MWILTCWIFLLVIFYQEFQCNGASTPGNITTCCPRFPSHWVDGWFNIRHSLLPTISECKNDVTTKRTDLDQTGSFIFAVNFQPKDQNGILGVSFCRDIDMEDCYVVEIFGLVSGRMGYYFRKQSHNETGEELWVPGKDSTLPSTVLQSDLTVDPETWDPQGETLYQFYIDDVFTSNGSAKTIRYNGGTAEQQEEMLFPVSRLEYRWVTVASYYKDSSISVEGALGCLKLKRMQLERGQDLFLYRSHDPHGSIGLSLCTDFGHSDCYVVEVQGMESGKLKYFWRRHSIFGGTAEEGWVPGKMNSNVKGELLATGEYDAEHTEGNRKGVTKKGITLVLKRSLDGKLVVGMNWGYDVHFSFESSKSINFTISSDHRFATAATRVRSNETEKVVRADMIVFGPCYNGLKLGFLTSSCTQDIPPQDPAYMNKDQVFNVYSPKSGLAESEMKSESLESKGVRKSLCISLVGIASDRGASVTVSAKDGSGKSNETVIVGQLIYNNIFPPVWQRVRVSIDLPPSLHNVPLVIGIKSKRQTAKSTVFLHDAKLCSDDGCGIPTPDGTPYIANGVETSPSKFPWHVGIYKAKTQKHFVFICGGTLIRPDVVISAAHCFVNNESKLEDSSKFKLAVGKVYNSIVEYEPNQQFSNAFDIQVPERYNGALGNFIHDIAIVRVNFTTTSLVLPACIYWSNNTLPSLEHDNVGEVAGWGLTEENIGSRKLRFAKLPYIPYSQCIEHIPESFVPFVTPDKFCAGHVNGSAVAKGDSGGGLAFKSGGLWYLRGVVSTGVPDRLTYSTFTDIAQFTPWIKRVLNITNSS